MQRLVGCVKTHHWLSVEDLVVYEKDEGMPKEQLLKAVVGAHGKSRAVASRGNNLC